MKYNTQIIKYLLILVCLFESIIAINTNNIDSQIEIVIEE